MAKIVDFVIIFDDGVQNVTIMKPKEARSFISQYNWN